MVCKDNERIKFTSFAWKTCLFSLFSFSTEIGSIIFIHMWGRKETQKILSRKVNIPFLIIFHTGEVSPQFSEYQLSNAKNSKGNTLKWHKININLWFLAWDCSVTFPNPAHKKIAAIWFLCYILAVVCQQERFRVLKMFIALGAIIKCVLVLRLAITVFSCRDWEKYGEVKFHVAMYKIVFKEGHGELAVFMLMGLM